MLYVKVVLIHKNIKVKCDGSFYLYEWEWKIELNENGLERSENESFLQKICS